MFASIFIPNFPVAAVFRAEPELHSQAVAIFEGKPPLEKIMAVSGSARSLGITVAMTKTQAELCPEVKLRTRSVLQELLAHAVLLDCAQSFSPCVEDAAADTVILDLAGMESLFGPAPEIARAIHSRAGELSLHANVAVAANPDAAVIAARGFAGVTVIPSGKEREVLGSLSVEVLFANGDEGGKEEKERLLATLDRWGIRNLRALAALPEIAFTERLGQQGLRLQKLARGEAFRTLVPVEEPAIFEEAIDLEFPILLLEPLAFLLNRMLEQICGRLASRALATQELRLTLELENVRFSNQQSSIDNQKSSSRLTIENQSESCSRSNRFHRTLRLPLPMLDSKLFLKLLQLDLNAHPPGAPIVKIHLAAEPARARSAQGGLFVSPAPEPEKLELTLARIASLVGEDRVGSVELLDTYRAEGFRMKHFVAGVVQPVRKKDLAEKSGEAVIAALRIFRPPLGVTVTVENGTPMRVICTNKKEVQGTVLWKAGPWRSSGDWWEREAWSRDEWDVALQSIEGVVLYRLVHDLLNGVWFVEGTYD
jgi:protein ImuB